MPNGWKIIFKIKIGDRVVTGEVYQDGELKVSTTLLNDSEGSFVRVGAETGEISPRTSGSEIEYEADNIEKLQAILLKESDFTEEEIKLIIQEFLKNQWWRGA